MNYLRLVLSLLWILVLLAALLTSAEAHRSGCHRWHSCPFDHGTYSCGDLGHCGQCPDNAYCQAGHPRTGAQQSPSLVSPPTAVAPATTPPLTARVTQIVDGDTIDVDLQGRRERVRYIGIDTPETKHPTRGVKPYGPEATKANRQLIEGQTVRLEFDVQQRDRYGRLLDYVYVDDTMVNAELVRQGYAQVAPFPPNVCCQDRFLQLQREAREAGRGLWAK